MGRATEQESPVLLPAVPITTELGPEGDSARAYPTQFSTVPVGRQLSGTPPPVFDVTTS